MDPEVRLSAYVCGWVGEAGGRGCGMLLLGRNLSERHMDETR